MDGGAVANVRIAPWVLETFRLCGQTARLPPLDWTTMLGSWPISRTSSTAGATSASCAGPFWRSRENGPADLADRAAVSLRLRSSCFSRLRSPLRVRAGSWAVRLALNLSRRRRVPDLDANRWHAVRLARLGSHNAGGPPCAGRGNGRHYGHDQWAKRDTVARSGV